MPTRKRPIVHDYISGEKRVGKWPYRLPYGRVKGYGRDPHMCFLLWEHHDRSVRPGHIVLLRVQIDSVSEQRTYRVLKNTREGKGHWWAELAAEKPDICVAGEVYSKLAVLPVGRNTPAERSDPLTRFGVTVAPREPARR
jgi:hypothetical protein